MANEAVEKFTKNELLAMMHQNTAHQLRLIAEYFTKHRLSATQINKLMLELADEADAHKMVAELKDTL